MRRHPQVGYDLLRKLPTFGGPASLVLAHRRIMRRSMGPVSTGIEGAIAAALGEVFATAATEEAI